MAKSTVHESNGRCRIKVTYLGNLYSLTQGDYSNPVDRERMERILLEAREEIRLGTFEGFDKHKKRVAPLNKARILELLGTLPRCNNLQGVEKHIRAWSKPLRNKKEIEALFTAMPVGTETKRRYYTLLRKIPELREVVNFSIKKPKTEETREINPFTSSEVERLLNAAKGNHYEPFILFMLHTGCRTSEAIGIRWADIEWENKRISFSSSLSINPVTGKRERKVTKTGKTRFTPMSQVLSESLTTHISVNHDGHVVADTLIFSAPEGGPINLGNFTRRDWAKLLESAGIPYRRPYNLRHTFISHCLQRGVDVVTVARWVGNSPTVIYQRYAGLVSGETLPKLF